MLEVDGLQITYGKTEVVRRVSFGVKPGEIIGICGRKRKREEHHAEGNSGYSG